MSARSTIAMRVMLIPQAVGCAYAGAKLALPGMQRLAFGFAFGLLAVLSAGGPVGAQNWPQRTVKLIVTLGAGSGVDIGARLLADRLSRRWSQPVVVENRP